MDIADYDNIQDCLWKVIGRFDYYIGSTNSKAGIIVAFNTFVLTGIVLKWSEIGALFAGNPKLLSIADFFLFFAATASAISLWFNFKAMDPFLRSPEQPGSYNSVVFFGHVSRHSDPGDYVSQLQGMNSQQIMEDLAKQAHVLAQGTTAKFKNMKLAITAILVVQIPSLILILVLKLCLVAYHLL